MIFGKYFLSLAVTKVLEGTSVCTYKRCKTCELIKETRESNEPMFMVTKKAVSQLGNACDLMLRNDFIERSSKQTQDGRESRPADSRERPFLR